MSALWLPWADQQVTGLHPSVCTGLNVYDRGSECERPIAVSPEYPNTVGHIHDSMGALAKTGQRVRRASSHKFLDKITICGHSIAAVLQIVTIYHVVQLIIYRHILINT